MKRHDVTAAIGVGFGIFCVTQVFYEIYYFAVVRLLPEGMLTSSARMLLASSWHIVSWACHPFSNTFGYVGKSLIQALLFLVKYSRVFAGIIDLFGWISLSILVQFIKDKKKELRV